MMKSGGELVGARRAGGRRAGRRVCGLGLVLVQAIRLRTGSLPDTVDVVRRDLAAAGRHQSRGRHHRCVDGGRGTFCVALNGGLRAVQKAAGSRAAGPRRRCAASPSRNRLCRCAARSPHARAGRVQVIVGRGCCGPVSSPQLVGAARNREEVTGAGVGARHPRKLAVTGERAD